jgi:hypothetical protein
MWKYRTLDHSLAKGPVCIVWPGREEAYLARWRSKMISMINEFFLWYTTRFAERANERANGTFGPLFSDEESDTFWESVFSKHRVLGDG